MSFFTDQSNDGRDDPYTVLGLSRDASTDQVKSAYRKLALRFHPDKQSTVQDKEKCSEIFTKISNAYEILSDERRRATYDRYGHMNAGRSDHHHQQQQPFSGIFSGFRGSFANDDFFYHDPFEVFRRAFSEEFHPSSSTKRTNIHGDFFRDPFFERDEFFPSFFNRHEDVMNMMNNGRGQTSFYSSTSYGGGSGGRMSESVSTTTKIINGKRQTITERTITHPDGTVERHTEKSGDDDFPLLSNNKSSYDVAGYLDSNHERRSRK